jgi:HEAT repeat protein
MLPQTPCAVNRAAAEAGSSGSAGYVRFKERGRLVPQLTSGMSRRLGRSGSRWLQWATHWGAFVRYLEQLEVDLGTVQLPGIGQVPLDATFVALRLRRWTPEAKGDGELATTGTFALDEALAAQRRVLVVGPAGTGKSALLHWQALSAARAVRQAGRRLLLSETSAQPLPVYIPLTAGTGDNLMAGAEARLRAAGFDSDAASGFLHSHLQAGHTLLLFDDLDTWAREDRQAAAERINGLLAAYPDNLVVVATRDVADEAWLPGFSVFEVVGIDPSLIETLAGRWGYGAVANTSGFLQVLERSPLVRSLVTRPGWLAASLAGVAGAAGPIRAYDIVAGFVHHLDAGDPGLWAKIALGLHEAHATVGAASRVPVGHRASGLLQWLSDGEFRFVHLAVQAFFAASATRDAAALVARADDPWWGPVITLAGGHLADTHDLIAGLVQSDHTALAGLVLAESRVVDPGLRRSVIVGLLGHLGGDDRDFSRRAAISLAGLLGAESVGHTGVVAPALVALTDGDVAIRRAAAAALGRLGEPSAIAPLLTSLGDPDAEVRAAGADALASFGERTVQPLVRQLSVPNEAVRTAALRALAQQGARAVPALVPLLEGPSSTGRAEAAEALALIGPPAVPALVRLLRGAVQEGTRNEAQLAGAREALVRIGPVAAGALVPVYAEAGPAARASILDVLRAMAQAAVDALAEIVVVPQDPYGATAAALLGEFPSAGRRAADPLMVALSDPRFEVRWEARRALRRLGPAASGALVEGLDRPDPQLRWEIAQILLELPDPPVSQLTGVLTEALSADDVNERRRAVKALGSLSGPAVRATLVSALDDPDPVVRRTAVNQLGLSGDRAAVQPLVARWAQERDPDTGRAILETLTDLSPKAAVPILIDALGADHAELNRVATELLIEVGEPAVIPLIQTLNVRPDLDHDGALRVLERAGANARPSGRSGANLARTYYRMLTEPLGFDELVYLASTMEWWPPALELHRTFDAARQFADYTSLGGIGTAETALEWVDDIPAWLRPSTPRALRQLRTISQAVQYYNRGATRRSKEKGLLAAADRLNTLRAMVPELGEPHARVFSAVGDRWSSLINAAIRELQGQADLDLEVRTDRVRIREAETAAVLVFEVVNRGEGLASNIQLSFSADADGVALESNQTHYLPPLGQGDRVACEFTVRRTGSGVAPITLDARYDDPQREGQQKRFVREVRFFIEDTPYHDIGTSPYIAGPPVKTPEMFYGRRSTFSWIQENLSGTYQENVLVLYGERRTGKTSMLYQMQYNLPASYAFVLIDLQSIAYSLSATSDLLYAMARKVVNGLRRLGFDELPRPERTEFAEHPIEHFEELGETIGHMATDMGRQAVIMLDEFDLLIEAVESGAINAYVFDCIRGLMQHQDGLSFIFAGAHKLSAMLKNPQSILFNTALRRKVGFLDREDAERLIREPVTDVMWYDDLALEKVLRVTAGHPYFIQYICHELVNLARRDGKNFVALRDVDRALLTTVQETTGIIRHSYMSLSRDERMALAALARITDDGRPFVGLEDIIETLRQDNVVVNKRDLIETLRQLVERDFITERGGEAAGRQYGFAMDLVRVWLEQNDEYTRLLEEVRA